MFQYFFLKIKYCSADLAELLAFDPKLIDKVFIQFNFRSEKFQQAICMVETTSSSYIPTNHTMDDDEYNKNLQELEKVVPILVPILFSIIILIGFIGNILVVLIVSFNKNMKNTTNLLILNLAVADILFIVFCIPFTAADYYLTSAWPFGVTWCKVRP